MGIETAVLVTMAATAAYGAYNSYEANRMAKNGPGIPASGPPANTISYDENGNETGSITWKQNDDGSWTQIQQQGAREPEKPTEPKMPDFKVDPQEAARRRGGGINTGPGGLLPPNPADYKGSTEGGWTTDDQGGVHFGNRGPNQADYEKDLAAYNKYIADKQKYDKDLETWTSDHATWQEAKDKRVAEKEKIDKMISDATDRVGMSWDERVAHYDEIAKTFAEQQHAQLDPQFAKEQRSLDETAAARGQTGSRAQVDTNAELAKAKLQSDEEVARNATLMKTTLGEIESAHDLNVLNALKSGATADEAMGLQSQQQTTLANAQANNITMANYAANANTAWNTYQAKVASANAAAQNLNNTATGLMFLYGYGSKGKSMTPSSPRPGGGGVGVGGMYNTGYSSMPSYNFGT